MLTLMLRQLRSSGRRAASRPGWRWPRSRTAPSNITTTGLNPPLLAGNIIAVGVSTILLVSISLIFPEKTPFDWELLKTQITTSDDKVSGYFLGCSCAMSEVQSHSSTIK